MAKKPAIKRVYYPNRSEMETESFRDIGIEGYYTFGSGQTLLQIGQGFRGKTPVRLGKEAFNVRGNPFDKYPSISNVNSPIKVFRWMVEQKIIVGTHYVLGANKALTKVELESKGLTTETRFLSANSYKNWYTDFRNQLKRVRADRSHFKDDSVRTESINMIKSTIRFIQGKYDWNAHDLKEIVDESAREFLIEDVIDN